MKVAVVSRCEKVSWEEEEETHDVYGGKLLIPIN
jgi:hypothetical protein